MATGMTTAARTTPAKTRPAGRSTSPVDELPDRTRWALDGYAALLQDQRIARSTLSAIDEHVGAAEQAMKAAAAADGITSGRLAKARLMLAEATGLDVAGTGPPAASPRTRKTPARRRSTPTARRRTRTPG